MTSFCWWHVTNISLISKSKQPYHYFFEQAAGWQRFCSAMIHRGKKYDVRNKTISFSMGQINDWIKTKDGNLTLEIRHTQRTVGDAMKAANIYFHEQQIKPTRQTSVHWKKEEDGKVSLIYSDPGCASIYHCYCTFNWRFEPYQTWKNSKFQFWSLYWVIATIVMISDLDPLVKLAGEVFGL